MVGATEEGRMMGATAGLLTVLLMMAGLLVPRAFPYRGCFESFKAISAGLKITWGVINIKRFTFCFSTRFFLNRSPRSGIR